MENVVGFLILLWIAFTNFTTLAYWLMWDLTPAKYEEAVALCGDRELKHIDLGFRHHTIVCKDGGEYELLAATKER